MKPVGIACTGFIWLRVRENGGLLCSQQWTLQFQKMQGIWLAEELLASQKWFCSMILNSSFSSNNTDILHIGLPQTKQKLLNEVWRKLLMLECHKHIFSSSRDEACVSLMHNNKKSNQKYKQYYFFFLLQIQHVLVYSPTIRDQFNISRRLQDHYLVTVKIQI
jgi:hypothetical protein